MALMDLLRNYFHKRLDDTRESSPGVPLEDYDEVTRSTPPEIVGHGVTDAFRDRDTPSFGEMVAQMFGHSNPQQRADVVNQLLHSIGPGVGALLAGILGRSSQASSDDGVPRLSLEQAENLTPAQVNEIATRAQRDDPRAMDKLGSFYAEHPQLVKTLGGAALAIPLAGIAKRMRRA